MHLAKINNCLSTKLDHTRFKVRLLVCKNRSNKILKIIKPWHLKIDFSKISIAIIKSQYLDKLNKIRVRLDHRSNTLNKAKQIMKRKSITATRFLKRSQPTLLRTYILLFQPSNSNRCSRLSLLNRSNKLMQLKNNPVQNLCLQQRHLQPSLAKWTDK